VELFRELLLTLDHWHAGRINAGKAEPVPRQRHLDWLDDHIADSDVEVEFHECSVG
jgi:hypothetical protein